MTISGMTGFARAEGEHAGQRWIWELKSVNGRGLDLKLRTPPGYDAIEPAARAATNAKFKRGSVQASLNIARDAAAAPPLKIDLELVERLIGAGEQFKGRVAKPRWDGILAVRGVVQSEDAAELEDVLETGAELLRDIGEAPVQALEHASKLSAIDSRDHLDNFAEHAAPLLWSAGRQHEIRLWLRS